jgi:hypothetical protein
MRCEAFDYTKFLFNAGDRAKLGLTYAHALTAHCSDFPIFYDPQCKRASWYFQAFGNSDKCTSIAPQGQPQRTFRWICALALANS